MTSTALRLLTTPAVAADLAADAVLTARSDVTVATGVAATLRCALARPVDLAVVRAGTRGAVSLAVALRGMGLPVWWIDALGTRCPGVGAPALVSSWAGSGGLDELAELANRPGAGQQERPPVSVVVTTLNEGNALDELLTGVRAQLGPRDEVIIVDGGSTDGSAERAGTAWADEPRVRIDVVAGAGISAGRNHGVRLARYDVIVCTDAGCGLADGWLEGMRRAFTAPNRPGLVSGPYRPSTGSSLATAQALACYPDPFEVRRADLLTRLYTRLFGTGFDPAFAIGRNVAFTRAAWEFAGGFPEHLATGEDVSFGLAVQHGFRCAGTSDAQVSWEQRRDLRSTWRMYRGYGRASTDGGDVRLLVRDGVRGAGYLLGLAALGSQRGRRLAALGALAYLSQPVRRARRRGVALRVYPLLPVALATKDLGKLTGACAGARARPSTRAAMNAPRTALVVTPTLGRGGAERHAVELASTLDRSRWTPHVLTLADGPLAADLEAAGVEVHVAPTGHSMRSLPRAALAVRRAIRQLDPAVISAHDVLGELSVRAAIAGAPRPLISWKHTYGHIGHRGTRERIAERLTGRLVTRYGAVCHTQVRYLTDELDLDPSRIRVVANTVREQQPTPMPDGALVAVMVAAMRADKGHASALRAWRTVVAQRPDARLSLVGDGPLRGELEALADTLGIRASVTFHGEVADPSPLVAMAHVLVIASYSIECFPYAVLEAMAAGRPVVATTVGGLPEMVDDRVTGLLVPPRDDAALAAALLTLASTPELSATLGEAARRRLQAVYPFAGWRDQIDTLLDEIARTHDRPKDPRP